MSWIRSIPIFHLLLVCLLAGDLGFNIFANANAWDCSEGWSSPGSNYNGWLCETKASGGQSVTQYGSKCGRNDGLLPSARDCVDEDGKLMNNGELWACDLVFDSYSDYRKDGRHFYCNQSKNVSLFYCRSMNKPQQCNKLVCSTTP
ncbi:uncharacterized protein MELLADRAFT_123559 [Melampsora larici-populina 98AG31]|uniref:Secreted protein n=1 Tax=Melampsora larici-populina (strain 98AG31 / pathotype 3-4-7) TaxID=747676 RepID=F4RME3_MELLP|nr:uncharacterized protein MELLADRAFT_123559 [Melampsora larici-populina 98AG31]EGG06488.1 secreted protein [Melampsora larici-populina 98AG31]